MYSYRIPAQISAFGNIKSSYGQFEILIGGMSSFVVFGHYVLITT